MTGLMPGLLPTFSEFLTWPELVGDDFANPSWNAWKTTAKGILGEPMDELETERFRELTGRDRPPGRVREAWLAIGRRAGKDSFASALATYFAACGNFQPHLRRGERAVVVCLAVNRDQAGIVFGYIRANFTEVPLLAQLVNRIGDGIVELNNGVDVVVATNSFRGLRGKTIAVAIFDEIAYWLSDEIYSNPDKEIYAAVLPGLTTLRNAGSMIIAISSVYRKAGLLFEKIQRYHGQNDPDVLAVLAPSKTYNPNLVSDALL
jgi:hypothetical protein